MSTAIKVVLAVLLFSGATVLAFFYQPNSERPISVSVITSPHGVKAERTRVVLKAAVNGNGLSHGDVRLDFTAMKPENLASFSNHHWSVDGCTDARGVFIWSANGHTDTRGVFIENCTRVLPGEYMVSASVRKPGCIDGKSVCFLRVAE